jgi:hypothetical protein
MKPLGNIWEAEKVFWCLMDENRELAYVRFSINGILTDKWGKFLREVGSVTQPIFRELLRGNKVLIDEILAKRREFIENFN